MNKVLEQIRPHIAKVAHWATLLVVFVDSLNAILEVIDKHRKKDSTEIIQDADVVEEK